MISVLVRGFMIGTCVYLAVAVLTMVHLYLSRDSWLPHFENDIKRWSFCLKLFFWSPVALTKMIFGEIK